jgi:ribosomal protein L3 glutamine methyltransferase
MAAHPRSPATLGEWLEHAIALYEKHELALGQVATNAHDEALYLLLHTLQLPMDSKPSVLKKKLTAEQQTRVKEVFRKRIEEHVPAGYLTNEGWLGDLCFYVDERVIIPRSYFLELLPEEIPAWLPPGKPVKRVVDVCTGSGCLAVLLAHQFPQAKVDAIELSPDAAAVAEINIAEHGLKKRITLHRSDVFDAVPPVKYDVILSNPPYVPTRELKGLPQEFKNEPRMALDGGKDGLDIIRKLLRQARERLQPHGIVTIEAGQAGPAMDKAFPELEIHWFETEDADNCVCVIRAERLLKWKG